MIKKYSLPVLWMLLIFILSSIPGNAFPKQPFPHFDVVVHFVEYSILGFLWHKALKGKFGIVVVICILFAISDEFHQIFVPLRECSIIDLAIDSIGIFAGILAGIKI